jgi:predicted ATP-dependent endonuclease of OLD family
MLKINNILIKGIGPIKELSLDFNPHFNIICGTNGVGKTTILESIAHCFGKGETNILKRNADSDKGRLNIRIEVKHSMTFEFQIKNFEPTKVDNLYTLYQFSDRIIVFKTLRNITYRNLTSVEKDPARDDNVTASLALQGVDFDFLKSWFIHRFVWSAHEGVLSEEQKNNFELAKSIFSILDPHVAFDTVKPSNDIMVKTTSGIIYYEYLSSGYKSALSILLGIITEIEFRFKEPTINVTDFDGVIIIDELDLHLHPEFQAAIYRGLKKIVPNAQVFTTTHSPHIIQVAEPHEIIALEISPEDNNISRKDLKNSSFGYKGWTLEEILTDVIGLKDTKSQEYRDSLKEFDMSMDEGNEKGVKSAYLKLKKILHPGSEIIKLLQIQLAGIGVFIND